jgi:hypothetical protein
MYDRNNFGLVFFAVLLFFFTSCRSSSVIEVKSKQNINIDLITFANFQKDTLKIGKIEVDVTKQIPLDYSGFALMLVNNIYPYPLIIGKDNIKMLFEKAETAPTFTHCPENEFFYDFFAAYNKFGNRIRQLEDAKHKLGKSDPFYPEIVQEIASIKEKKRKKIEKLPNPKFPVASAILQEKLVEEKSWKIKTIDELHTTQKLFVDFIQQNYSSLEHSEQITALINQSYMMIEYINFFDAIGDIKDKKIISQKANQLFRDEVMHQTEMWIETLQPYMTESKALSQCLRAYFNRGMIGQSYEILYHFKEKAICEKGQKDSLLSFPKNFDIVGSDGFSKKSIQKIHSRKLIVLIDNDCIFSKIIAIQKARELEKSNTKVIILPKEELTQEILSLDKLCVKNLYFIKDKSSFDSSGIQHILAPAFFELDENNNLIK